MKGVTRIIRGGAAGEISWDYWDNMSAGAQQLLNTHLPYYISDGAVVRQVTGIEPGSPPNHNNTTFYLPTNLQNIL